MTNEALVSAAYEIVNHITHRQEISPDKIDFNPLVESEDKADNWVGAQLVYHTNQRPSTRLQIVFGSKDSTVLEDNPHIHDESIFATKPELRVEWLSQFDPHPDPKVKAILLELASVLEDNDFVSYGVSWVKEFEKMPKERRDELAGLQGIFFPTLHFHQEELQWDVVVRCEGVVELEMEA